MSNEYRSISCVVLHTCFSLMCDTILVGTSICYTPPVPLPPHCFYKRVRLTKIHRIGFPQFSSQFAIGHHTDWPTVPSWSCFVDLWSFVVPYARLRIHFRSFSIIIRLVLWCNKLARRDFTLFITHAHYAQINNKCHWTTLVYRSLDHHRSSHWIVL